MHNYSIVNIIITIGIIVITRSLQYYSFKYVVVFTRSVFIYLLLFSDINVKETSSIRETGSVFQPLVSSTSDKDTGIYVQDLTASWSMDTEKPTLKNISFNVDQVIYNIQYIIDIFTIYRPSLC